MSLDSCGRFRLHGSSCFESYQIRDPTKERNHEPKPTPTRYSMYGDLQGIVGKSFQEIEGLELQALEFEEKPSAE